MLIFLLLFLGFPSPLFLYLWYLYLSMFSSLREAETAKTLANSFRMVHAIFCSMPLMIINLATLYHQLLADGFEQYAMDIKELGKHFENVLCHIDDGFISLFPASDNDSIQCEGNKFR